MVSTLAGCAHGGPTGEAIESAYLEARLPQGACPAGDAACCADRAAAARAASESGETARAAALWEGVALSCPAARDQAGAAVLAASRLGPGAAGRVINVNYRAQLPPSVRLYWVSAALGERLLPVDAPTGAHPPLKVEVHAIRFAGGRPGPLLTANRTFDVVIGEGNILTVHIAQDGGGALTLDLKVDRPPASGPAPVATVQPRKGPTPPLEKARALRFDPPRAPPEFGAMLRGVRPALRLCLDREGDLDTVRFLEQAHPRLAASMLDMLRDARHSPYRVGDTAVPSCETMERGPSRGVEKGRAAAALNTLLEAF